MIATAEPGDRPKGYDVERLSAERAASLGQPGVADAEPSAAGEPLAEHWQWDMRMIHATPNESYAVERGKRGVLVGIMDTGIDAAHPDIAPNFNAALSCNFTTDSAARRLHDRRPACGLQRILRRRNRVQRFLRPRHRERAAAVGS